MNGELNRNSVVCRSKGQVSSLFDDEVVALGIETGRYYQMDQVGRTIWEFLESPVSISRICERLVVKYDVELERCQEEVGCFLNSLHVAGLIELYEDVAS